MVFILVFFVLVIIIMYFRKIERFVISAGEEELIHSKEASSTDAPSKEGNYVNKEDVEPIIEQKVNLVLTPIIISVNSIIDTMNEVPVNLYDKCVTMSQKISSKIKEYAETMRSYNRSKDDEESLKTVVVNQRHKLYIDNVRKNNTGLYTVLGKVSNEFYQVPFDKQDVKLMEILTVIGNYEPNVEALIKEKKDAEITTQR